MVENKCRTLRAVNCIYLAMLRPVIMLVEGEDENGNRVMIQAVHRGKTVYLRRAAKQSLDFSARTPRRLWILVEVTELFSEQFGEKRKSPMPVTAEVPMKFVSEILLRQ